MSGITKLDYGNFSPTLNPHLTLERNLLVLSYSNYSPSNVHPDFTLYPFNHPAHPQARPNVHSLWIPSINFSSDPQKPSQLTFNRFTVGDYDLTVYIKEQINYKLTKLYFYDAQGP